MSCFFFGKFTVCPFSVGDISRDCGSWQSLNLLVTNYAGGGETPL